MMTKTGHEASRTADGDRLDFFAVMEPRARAEALARTRVVKARKGKALLGRGDKSADVFFVIEGRLHVVLFSSQGREISLNDLQGSDMFGEIAAIDGESRSASIVAVTESRLLAMSRADFRAALEASPHASIWLMRKLTGRRRTLTERVFELSALTVQARLHCELLRMAASSPSGLEISPAPTHAELANRIGTHREAVTREMRALAAQNIIRTGRRRLEFIDLARLRSAVDRSTAQGEEQDGGLDGADTAGEVR